MKLEGSCHCGAVTFRVNSKTPYPYNWCYCSICRKTAGGGGYAINIMAEASGHAPSGQRGSESHRAEPQCLQKLLRPRLVFPPGSFA